MNISNRDKGIDSLKGFLIILVVFGHMIEPICTVWPFNLIYTIIYSFHMPLFVLISGYVFPFDSDIIKLKRGVLCLLETYITFHIIWITFSIAYTNKFDLHMLINPSWTLWYLLSLIFWRSGSYLLFCKVKRTTRNITILFITSLFFSVFVGFIPLSSEMSFQRTFVFYPYFLIGMLFRQISIRNVSIECNQNTHGEYALKRTFLKLTSPLIPVLLIGGGYCAYIQYITLSNNRY